MVKPKTDAKKGTSFQEYKSNASSQQNKRRKFSTLCLKWEALAEASWSTLSGALSLQATSGTGSLLASLF